MDFDPENMPQMPKPQPIPELLHSVYEKGPFKTCNVCSMVLTDGRIYEIQKVFRGKEAIFEMAVCHGCGESIAKEFSEESKENMKSFLESNFRTASDPSHCHFCGFPRAIVPNFTIVGMCKENSLLVPSIIMCDKCSEKLQTKLSRKTRDTQGDFIRDNFPGVPEGLDISPAPTLGFVG